MQKFQVSGYAIIISLKCFFGQLFSREKCKANHSLTPSLCVGFHATGRCIVWYFRIWNEVYTVKTKWHCRFRRLKIHRHWGAIVNAIISSSKPIWSSFYYIHYSKVVNLLNIHFPMLKFGQEIERNIFNTFWNILAKT